MSSEASFSTESRLPDSDGMPKLPLTGLPFFSRVPDVSVMWKRLLILIWLYLAYLGLWDLMRLTMHYWYLESFSLQTMFWTNFRSGSAAFGIGLVAFAGAIIAPAYIHKVPAWTRRVTIHFGLLVGCVAGYYLQSYYLDFLLLVNGDSFGKTDPVFSKDISFYVFSLPSYWIIWGAGVVCLIMGLLSSLRCASFNVTDMERFKESNRFNAFLRRCATPCTLAYVAATGALLAAGPWLSRYEVLYKDNSHLRISGGAQYLDVNGLFSTLNSYWVAIFVTLGITVVILSALVTLRRSDSVLSVDARRKLRRAGAVVALLFLLDLGFNVGIWVRQVVFVTPEEPVVQLPYIKTHIDYTMDAYGLNDVEVVNFLPKGDDDPLPDLDELLQSVALKNAPIWPGFTTYLETHIDPQHADLILQTDGDSMIYGPTKELFRQQQKLRMYYDIISVDSVRYNVDGDKQLFVSAVRELPKYSPQPWLYHWSQRMMWYTHGYGIVAARASQVTGEGNPVYAVRGIPSQSSAPALELADHRVYFGEESASPFLSNLKGFTEFGNPTDDMVAASEFPLESKSGVLMDSFLKRLILGWSVYDTDRGVYPRTFWEILVSDMITKDTKLHFWRRPIERLDQIAPFLFYDTNSWAVVADEGKLVWMVNGMTTSNQYPYSRRRMLGDKATIRTRYPRDHVEANYIRDSVKCTVDARTGEVQFYKFADEPILNTWQKIYPGLIVDQSEMPKEVRNHLQYPLQLFHRQFDDIYKSYHMRDPIDFFNMVDLWDDCDEVLGPVRDKGDAITFSFEPYQWIADTNDGTFPKSSEGTQFTMAMPFTNEKAMNMRAIPMVYQDGDNYGKLFCLSFPKGHYRMSPEQADAAIDQEPTISEQISWWNRLGNDVIHGHTTPLVALGEMIYIEPLFIRSQQEPYSQLKKVCVVFRGTARIGNTLEEALRLAIEAQRNARSELKVAAASRDASGAE